MIGQVAKHQCGSLYRNKGPCFAARTSGRLVTDWLRGQVPVVASEWPWPLVPHLTPRQATKFVVYQRQPSLEYTAVAVAPIEEQFGYSFRSGPRHVLLADIDCERFPRVVFLLNRRMRSQSRCQRISLVPQWRVYLARVRSKAAATRSPPTATAISQVSSTQPRHSSKHLRTTLIRFSMFCRVSG
jgi:hypothetical protein